jgi:precorrin-2 dehydrogenase/sirohydrochlorin ferrochelatase
MFPILLDLAKLRVALVGNGPASVRRLALLDEDDARHVTVFADAPSPELAAAAGARLRHAAPSAADLAGMHIVFAADLDEGRAAALAATVQALGILLHVEDRPALGSVHAPAQLRRGDLLLTVSTNGRSPGLARRLKRFLEGLFGAEWQERLDTLAALRQGWRESGALPTEIARWTEEWVDRHHWLDTDAHAAPLAPVPQRRDGALLHHG